MRRPWEWNRTPLALPPTSCGQDDGPPCVIHLVRAANGIDSLREFAAAMRAHPPGVEHELVLALKGFGSWAQAAPYIAQVADLEPTIEFFPDMGLDLGVLFGVAARLRRGRYCFVNSHTRPVVAGWLAKLDAALALPGVGMVGATGSWLSSHSWLAFSLGLPSFYRSVLPPIHEARRLLLEIDLEQLHLERRSRRDSLRARLALLSQVPEELLAFAPFPTPHLRNTMLMVGQLARIGQRALVVDSAGVAYEPAEWYRSGTYWQGGQERLLAIDNRTLAYERGGAVRRRVLSALSWGLHADPGP
jgi:hypothetical protein